MSIHVQYMYIHRLWGMVVLLNLDYWFPRGVWHCPSLVIVFHQMSNHFKRTFRSIQTQSCSLIHCLAILHIVVFKSRAIVTHPLCTVLNTVMNSSCNWSAMNKSYVPFILCTVDHFISNQAMVLSMDDQVRYSLPSLHHYRRKYIKRWLTALLMVIQNSQRYSISSYMYIHIHRFICTESAVDWCLRIT